MKTLSVLFVILAGCWPYGCTPHRTAEGKQVFRLNLFAGLNSLDPALANNESSIRVVSQLYSGLVRLDTNLAILPDLAHRWEIEDSGRTYVFHLRRGVRYHPDACFGGPEGTRGLSAHDFVYALTRVVAPKTASPGAWVYNDRVLGVRAYQAGEATSVAGFHAPDDSTLVIRLVAAFPPFLSMLTMPYAFAIPREAVEAYGAEFRQRPVGTGPFRLWRWDEGLRLVLHRNPDYWDAGLPNLDAVEVRFMASKLSAYAAFRQGELDVLESLDPAVAADILQPDGTLRPHLRSLFRAYSGPQLTTEYFGCMVRDSIRAGHPLRKPLVRRAILHALNREKLVRYLLRGLGSPASGFVPVGMAGFLSADTVLYNLPLARALLAQAGYPNGRGLPPLTLVSNPNYRLASDFLQKALAEIGIRLEVHELEGGALRQQVYAGQADFWRASWISDYPDPENFLALFYGPNAAPDGPNTSRYANPAFDALYRQALATTKDSSRIALYQKMNNMVLADAPVIPLYFYRSLRLLSNRVAGFRHCPSPLVLDLRFVSVAHRE